MYMCVYVHMCVCVCVCVCVTELKALDPTMGLYTDIDENDEVASHSSCTKKSTINNSIHMIIFPIKKTSQLNVMILVC